LSALRIKSEISQEMTAQSAQTTWANTVNTFFDQTSKADGVDYRTDTARQADLDMFTKSLANNAANEGQTMDWFLAEAHKRVQALHGAVVAAAPVPLVKESKADAIAAANKRRAPPLAALQQTLAHVPGGDGPGDVGSEFAHLDALEGEALESAIGKMSAAQREKFSRGE